MRRFFTSVKDAYFLDFSLYGIHSNTSLQKVNLFVFDLKGAEALAALGLTE
jgi:hypothetical protein